MAWRVALIDSCGAWPGAHAAAFVSDGRQVECRDPVADPTGHGSRIAELLTCGLEFELLLGQVFTDAGAASGAAVAAAIEWSVARGASLVHLSLGLEADRAVLAAAVERAIDAGCIIVAATPARGAAVYPAAYPRVIRGTGDARCAPRELSCLGSWVFGACPRFESAGQSGSSAGASVGAARVTRTIVEGPLNAVPAVLAALTARAKYLGPERKRPART